ncbi:Multidrug resistance protein MdtC [Stutzerimonas stutzeri]
MNAGLPLFVLVVVTLLMVQLRSFSRSAMVFLTAPLGIIGVTLFLLLFRQPFGFVAMLGTIALSGMIMRNSVILVDQIEQDIGAGHDRFNAIIDAAVRRFRPIVLTALASVLAMIPLSRSIFFGPMAVAIMGGLIVATALTLLFLPALYAAWFRVRETEPNPPDSVGRADAGGCEQLLGRRPGVPGLFARTFDVSHAQRAFEQILQLACKLRGRRSSRGAPAVRAGRSAARPCRRPSGGEWGDRGRDTPRRR